MKPNRAHGYFKYLVEQELIAEGYEIIGREVKLKDIIINGKFIIVDLLVKRGGKIIPVECGQIQPPKQERLRLLKTRFGAVKHIRYGQNRQHLLNYIENPIYRTTLL